MLHHLCFRSGAIAPRSPHSTIIIQNLLRPYLCLFWFFPVFPIVPDFPNDNGGIVPHASGSPYPRLFSFSIFRFFLDFFGFFSIFLDFS